MATPEGAWKACAAPWGKGARVIPLVLLLLGSPLFLGPHAVALDPDRSIHQLHHRKWTAKEGGPSQVGALAQTTDGYLWLGTNHSLFRFDGFRFERYVSPAGETFATISSLHAPPTGELWVGLRFGGVARVTRDGVTHYGGAEGLPAGAVYALASDHEGNVWAAANDGLARFDGSRWQHVSSDQGFAGHNARSVFVDHDGTVWAASEDRLRYLKRGAPAFVDSGEAVDWVRQIAQGPDGTLWIAEMNEGAVRPLTLTERRHSPVLDVASNGLLFDRDGVLWVATLGHGLRRVTDAALRSSDPAPAIETFTSDDDLSADYVGPLLEDNEGNLWIGTSNGLDRFRHTAVVPARLPSGAHNFALAADGEGTVWIGSSNQPTMRLSGDTLRLGDPPPPVTAAYRDREGNIWLGGPHGIWRITDDENEPRPVTRLPEGATAESAVRAIVRDRDGRLWVSINRLGLFVLDGQRWSPTPTVSTHPDQSMPVSAAHDRQGHLWFGYRHNLIVTRNGEEVRRWSSEDGLAIGHVTAMHHGTRRSWVAGQHGVALFDGTRFHTLQLDAPQALSGLYAIIETPAITETPTDSEADDNDWGDLWLHSLAGIYHIPAGEVRQAMRDAAHRLRYRTFDAIDGLPNDPHQVHPVPTAIEGSDGRLWFATGNGVIWINPAQLYDNPVPPLVVIEALRADDTPLPPTMNTTLPTLTQRIAIDYTALSLGMPEGLRFRYRLDGYDSRWHAAESRREAIYTGLGPGAYRFRVTAANSDGVWSPEEATLAFHIPPMFYQTRTFLVACLVALMGILWLLYRIKLRRASASLRIRLEERHGERERIARELHDTLLQGFQGLLLRFQAVAETIPDNEPARRRLEQVLDRADEVLSEGRDRVKDLRSSPPVDADLPTVLAAIGRELSEGHAARYDVLALGAPQPLQAIVQDEVCCIVHEALANAFQHAQATLVEVVIDYAPRACRISVSDDGRGIDPAFLTSAGRPGHWGLFGMRERAAGIGARLDILRRDAAGTEVRLTLPSEGAYRDRPRRLPRWLLRITRRRR